MTTLDIKLTLPEPLAAEAGPVAPVVVSDPDDDHVLACAIVASADLVVSGDRDLLELHAYQGIPILKPADALSRIAVDR